MSEPISTVEKLCPQCHNAVDADAHFCKYCAFNLTDAHALQTTQEKSEQKSAKSNTLVISVIICLGAVCLLVAASYVTGFIFSGERVVQIATGNVNAANQSPALAPAMSAKGLQAEEKLMHGGLLDASDLEGLTAAELRLLRNVNFARYGRKYTQPELNDYFRSRPWYKPNDAYNHKLLTTTDKDNIKVILSVEKPETVVKTETSNTNTFSGTTSSLTDSTSSSGSSLSQNEMLGIMQRNGLLTPMDGRQTYDRYEILRVGEFNQEKKYYPIQIKTYKTTRDGKTWINIYDCRIFKNDYGDWDAWRVQF